MFFTRVKVRCSWNIKSVEHALIFKVLSLRCQHKQCSESPVLDLHEIFRMVYEGWFEDQVTLLVGFSVFSSKFVFCPFSSELTLFNLSLKLSALCQHFFASTPLETTWWSFLFSGPMIIQMWTVGQKLPRFGIILPIT